MRLRGHILCQDRTTAPCWVLGGGSKDVALVTTVPLSFSIRGAGAHLWGPATAPADLILTMSLAEVLEGGQ